MTLPLSSRPSRQCGVILSDDDIDSLDTLCAATGESRSALMRSFIRLGTALMLDPITAVPLMLEGIEKNLAALADLDDTA